eukprot:scaffold1941_cov263-Pinguiococcus_pyrenoidosus.AAC.27
MSQLIHDISCSPPSTKTRSSRITMVPKPDASTICTALAPWWGCQLRKGLRPRDALMLVHVRDDLPDSHSRYSAGMSRSFAPDARLSMKSTTSWAAPWPLTSMLSSFWRMKVTYACLRTRSSTSYKMWSSFSRSCSRSVRSSQASVSLVASLQKRAAQRAAKNRCARMVRLRLNRRLVRAGLGRLGHRVQAAHVRAAPRPPAARGTEAAPGKPVSSASAVLWREIEKGRLLDPILLRGESVALPSCRTQGEDTKIRFQNEIGRIERFLLFRLTSRRISAAEELASGF